MHLRDHSQRMLHGNLEDHFRLLVENSPEGMVICDEDNRIIFANAGFCEMFGWGIGEVTGKNISEAAARSPEEASDAFIISAMAILRPPIIIDAVRLRKDGTEVNVSILAGPIFEEGRPVGTYMIYKDTSHSKEVERTLRESQQRFSNIVEDQDEFIIRFKPDGTLTFANSSYCRRFGKVPEEIMGLNIFDHVGQDESSRLQREHFEKLTPENPTNTDESWSLLPDGSVGLEQWHNRGIFDQEGRLVAIQCVGRDITTQKEAEQALKKSERRYAAIVESQVEMVCRFTPGGEITFANDAFCHFFGYARDQAISRRLAEIMGDAESSKFLADPDRLSSSDQDLFFEHNLELPQGGKRWLRWTRRGIINEKGALIEIQAVGRDLTCLKRSEEKLRQLNSILRSIRGVNRLISRHHDSEKLVQEICAHLVETRGYRNAWIGILGKGETLTSVSEAGIDPEGRPVSERRRHSMLNEWGLSALKNPGVHLKQGTMTLTDSPLLDSYEEGGIMTTRLEYAKKIYGLISVSLPGDAHFDPEEQTLFSELAEDISFALHAIETDEDRKKKAATLEEKARQLELLVLEHSSGLWEWDVNEGRVTMNSAYETMLGYFPGEMGQSLEEWKSRIHPDDLTAVTDLLKKVLSGMDGDDIHEIEFRMLKKEGTWMLLRSRGFVVSRDKNGRATKMVGIHTPAR